MSFSWEFLCVPSRSDTVVTSTFGDTDAIDHLVFGENSIDWDGIFEVISDPIDFIGDRTTIDLDFHKVGLLLSKGESRHLGMANGPDGDGMLLQ